MVTQLMRAMWSTYFKQDYPSHYSLDFEVSKATAFTGDDLKRVLTGNLPAQLNHPFHSISSHVREKLSLYRIGVDPWDSPYFQHEELNWDWNMGEYYPPPIMSVKFALWTVSYPRRPTRFVDVAPINPYAELYRNDLSEGGPPNLGNFQWPKFYQWFTQGATWGEVTWRPIIRHKNGGYDYIGRAEVCPYFGVRRNRRVNDPRHGSNRIYGW